MLKSWSSLKEGIAIVSSHRGARKTKTTRLLVFDLLSSGTIMKITTCDKIERNYWSHSSSFGKLIPLEPTDDSDSESEAVTSSVCLPNEAPEETEPAQGHIKNRFEYPSPANRKRPRTCLAESGQMATRTTKEAMLPLVAVLWRTMPVKMKKIQNPRRDL